MKNRSIHALLIALLALAAVPAHAGLILRLDDGVNQLDIADGGAFDQNALTGAVGYFGAFGDSFLNIATGSSKPVVGGPYGPQLSLTSIVSSMIGSLDILLTDTDFLGPVGNATAYSMVGGVTTGNIAFNTYLDASNAEFGMGSALAEIALPGFLYSGREDSAVSAAAPFSLTIAATITHLTDRDFTLLGGNTQILPSRTITSHTDVHQVPEPGTVSLLGAGLVGMFLRRRRQRG
jgi:hypothetical protein